MGYCRDAGKFDWFSTSISSSICQLLTDLVSIVEYATREQAQNAVATLSNQNLMGRLVYVREVRRHCASIFTSTVANTVYIANTPRIARLNHVSINHQAPEAVTAVPWEPTTTVAVP